MANRRALERLWRLRELEEEQSRIEMEARIADREAVARQLAHAARRAVRNRGDFASRLGDPDTAARTGALFEWEQAQRRQEALRPRVAGAETQVDAARAEFLTRRAGRLQVETLLDRERSARMQETARRAQQMLDDWYGTRTRAAGKTGTRVEDSRKDAKIDGDPKGDFGGKPSLSPLP